MLKVAPLARLFNPTPWPDFAAGTHGTAPSDDDSCLILVVDWGLMAGNDSMNEDLVAPEASCRP